MAYKSKEKFLERDGKTLSYCHIDPKSGRACTAHIHPADLDLTKADAKRLRELGEELINIADKSAKTETSRDISHEDIYTVLGMSQVKAKTQVEANEFLDSQTVMVEAGITDKTDFGKWLSPNPELGAPECDCGRPLEIRELKDGKRVWHHTDHAELDSYTGFYDENDMYNHYEDLSYTPDYWSETDVEMIELNAGVGTRYWYQSEYAFAPIAAEEYYDGKDVGPSWNWEPNTTERRYNVNHPTVPAQNCLHCGSQNLEYKTLRSGFLKLAKDSEQTLMCKNCGGKAIIFN